MASATELGRSEDRLHGRANSDEMLSASGVRAGRVQAKRNRRPAARMPRRFIGDHLHRRLELALQAELLADLRRQPGSPR
jgi:hypothetical protein